MAAQKNYTEVLIGGKVITLAGYETEEYLQKVATYLNHKITECRNSDGYCRQNASMQNTLLALNIADDYFKAKKLSDALERDIETKDKEMYDLKHDLISIQIKLENAEKLIENLKLQNSNLEKEQIKLETEIKTQKK
ncbi:MAG: cell division protein ZapA [Eubacteriales bacterium]